MADDLIPFHRWDDVLDVVTDAGALADTVAAAQGRTWSARRTRAPTRSSPSTSGRSTGAPRGGRWRSSGPRSTRSPRAHAGGRGAPRRAGRPAPAAGARPQGARRRAAAAGHRLGPVLAVRPALQRLRALGDPHRYDGGALEHAAARARLPLDRRWYAKVGALDDAARAGDERRRGGAGAHRPRSRRVLAARLVDPCRLRVGHRAGAADARRPRRAADLRRRSADLRDGLGAAGAPAALRPVRLVHRRAGGRDPAGAGAAGRPPAVGRRRAAGAADARRAPRPRPQRRVVRPRSEPERAPEGATSCATSACRPPACRRRSSRSWIACAPRSCSR